MLGKAPAGGTSLIDPRTVVARLDIHDGDIVADLGCGGGGHFINSLSTAVGAKGKVFALDIQKNVLKVVEAKMKLFNLSNVTTVWSDLERDGSAGIISGSCTIALLLNVLFQNSRYEKIVQESLRMIMSGGRLVVIDWKPSGSPFGPPSDRRISPQKVKEIAQSLGITLLEEFEAGPYHYALVFKK
ncbi:MAG: class I SAM-dependent methyltransferase [bacterium]|nr:class I SAM-dependent methyltransferase [bacterium]